jgi:hypothetical protein
VLSSIHLSPFVSSSSQVLYISRKPLLSSAQWVADARVAMQHGRQSTHEAR